MGESGTPGGPGTSGGPASNVTLMVTVEAGFVCFYFHFVFLK